MNKKQIQKLRVSLNVLLSILHGDEFKGGDLKGINISEWCKSASARDILHMAEGHSLLDF
jgi:hypothetical protein